MKVHVLQHVPFEGIGSITSCLSARNATIGYTRFYDSPSLPETTKLDLLIIMGGPMGVNDEPNHPWLKTEKRYIREVIERGVPTVGVCLGAQLIANSLGARVYPNQQVEIGWFDIESVPGDDSCFRFPRKATVFHWHGETFDLPDNAVCLARSTACDNQAFQLGANVIGMQFHLETTLASANLLINNCRHELVEGTFIQPEAAMRAMPEKAYNKINRLMEQVLSYVTGS